MRRRLVLCSSTIIRLSCRKSRALARSAPSRLRYPAKTGARPGRHRHGPGLAALALGGLDVDHSRHRYSRRGDPHLEHAVRVLRLHLGAVDASSAPAAIPADPSTVLRITLVLEARVAPTPESSQNPFRRMHVRYVA